MGKERIIFIADSLDNAYRLQHVLATMNVDVAAGSSKQFDRLLASVSPCSLVIYELPAHECGDVASVQRRVLEAGEISLLFVVKEALLPTFACPSSPTCDFIVSGASEAEFEARIRLLLGTSDASAPSEIIHVDGMTLNLATYQVNVNDEPVDFTYLEYALLAFLVTHAGRTYSRDALLRHVWGFDYYGGSRTVDVHVRRVRAKLGPDLANHLETVRGVGYLWD